MVGMLDIGIGHELEPNDGVQAGFHLLPLAK
jgi:hypothetical protein